MAAKFYGAALGANMKTEVTTGAATTSLAVELQVANTTATGQTKETILKGLEAIRQAIIADTYPGA